MQEPREGVLDIKVVVPITCEWALEHAPLGQWSFFKNELPASEFRKGVEEWYDDMTYSLCWNLKKELDVYRQYIQAQNPHKRIKYEEGNVQVESG